MSKILVTGSEGTLGKPLCEELEKRGHRVDRCDLKHSISKNYRRVDVAEYRQIKDIIYDLQPDYIYHLAAEFGRMNGEQYYEQVWRSNVIGTRNILEVQKEFLGDGPNLIFASSSEIYGNLNDPILNEDLIPAAQENDYAISKWVNEIQCRNFRSRYANRIMTLRFFNAYGPGEFYNAYRSVCTLFCYRALHKIPYQVFEGYHRVFMFIDDFIPTLANACDRFVDGAVINIGGEEYRSVKELSDIVMKCSGGDPSLVKVLPEDKHNVVNKRPDITRAKEMLGHNPTTTLEEGIAKTIEWMKEVYRV
jgi:dTDP-glucose 4,6-dehydratase